MDEFMVYQTINSSLRNQTDFSLCRSSRRAPFEILLLVLALVLRLRELQDKVGHIIPRVVDSDEQEQKRCRANDERCQHGIGWEHNCGDDECRVGDERKDRMPYPVFQHWLIGGLTARPSYYDDDVCHSPETEETQQKARLPGRLHGALRSAAIRSAAPKCTTFGVL